ncbi:MAG TPA: hypothetical protein VK674_07260 [Candidatus Limnocylindria bacterium]|nr:hypothetical protein [Candidatus Limnocylindria bacterium]
MSAHTPYNATFPDPAEMCIGLADTGDCIKVLNIYTNTVTDVGTDPDSPDSLASLTFISATESAELAGGPVPREVCEQRELPLRECEDYYSQAYLDSHAVVPSDGPELPDSAKDTNTLSWLGGGILLLGVGAAAIMARKAHTDRANVSASFQDDPLN